MRAHTRLPTVSAAARASLKYFLGEASDKGMDDRETVLHINIKFPTIVSRVP